MADAAEFVRRLRTSLGVDRMAYALVPEFHADGHVHAHILLDRYVAKDALGKAWGHGWVDVRKFRGKDGAGARESARRAAAYASKYVAKMFEEGMPRRHRYEVAEGFQPAVVKRSGYCSFSDALAFVEDHGQTVVFAICSDDLEDFDGPPFVWVSLDDG
jgi:hypothetical protein